MHHQEELQGTVDRIIFHNEENGFTIFVINTSRSHSALIKGHAPTLHAGEQVTVKGAWVMHPKFGKQFQAESCSISLPTTLIGIKKYLASGMIKGIGPVYAEKLIKKFGEKVLEIIDAQPYRLHEVPGIGPKRVDRIIAAWQDQKEISHIMVFLQDKGISPAYATKIYKKYGMNAIAVLQENPYRLADDIWGVGFKVADQIAQNMGFTPDCQKRISSGILYALSQEIGNGHLYAELENLKETAAKLLALDGDIQHLLKLALHELYNTDRIKLISYQEQHFITLSSYYHVEKGVAQRIKQLLSHQGVIRCNPDQVYQHLRTQTQLTLNDDQQRGIMSCLQQKITIITGGPGTGKTTLVKALLTILEQHKVVYKLAAPTGRAAKRITETTRRHAATLHRLLEFDVSTMQFKHNEQNALKLDVLIVDEASMIDIFLAHGLLKALPYHAQLILIGDVDQLPSVGAGNVLHDLIQSEQVATIRLTQIFRQAENSLIIQNAHRINRGEFPTFSLPNTEKDFLYIKEQDPAKVATHLERIYAKIPSKKDSIVLTPMNRGVAGTIALNDMLQKLLNKSDDTKQVQFGGTVFKLHDRVMQIRNNYDKNVFNGDMGFIEDIDQTERTITVRFIDQMVTYESNEFDEIVLAYATSIHKSQGSEFDTVIIPIFMQHFMLLQRNLIYTAVTRAKKLCILIGQPKAIAIAIKNDKGTERTTFLTQFLTSDLQCR
jgi:exodeoxyribonuclease V alpha subunit